MNLKNVWKLRCPLCGQSPVFRGMFAMHKECPSCGIQFEREPGYFLGAMFVSYVISAGFLTMEILLLGFIPRLVFWSDRIIIACLLFLPFVPWIFRFSRVFWIAFDRWIDQSKS